MKYSFLFFFLFVAVQVKLWSKGDSYSKRKASRKRRDSAKRRNLTGRVRGKVFKFPFMYYVNQPEPSRRVSSYPFVSGDTFRAYCDFVIDTTNRMLNTKDIKNGDIIFLRNVPDVVDFFFKTVHPQIKAKYILMTHNEDLSHFDSYVKYLDSDNIVAWCGMNLGIKHEKAFPLPIGIVNKCWSCRNKGEACGNIETLNGIMSDLPIEKDIFLYMNFTFETNPTVSGYVMRNQVRELFLGKDFCCEGKRKPYKDYLYDMARSKFVLSPEGYATDCYRTWEALLVGSIPIVASSGIDSLFEDLPVIITDDWNKITKEFLDEKYREISSKLAAGEYKLEKLYMDYWLEKIGRLKLVHSDHFKH